MWKDVVLIKRFPRTFDKIHILVLAASPLIGNQDLVLHAAFEILLLNEVKQD